MGTGAGGSRSGQGIVSCPIISRQASASNRGGELHTSTRCHRSISSSKGLGTVPRVTSQHHQGPITTCHIIRRPIISCPHHHCIAATPSALHCFHSYFTKLSGITSEQSDKMLPGHNVLRGYEAKGGTIIKRCIWHQPRCHRACAPIVPALVASGFLPRAPYGYCPPFGPALPPSKRCA